MNPRTRFILGAVLFGCILLGWFSGIAPYVTVEEILVHVTFFKQMVHEHYFFAVISYCMVYIFSAVFAIPIASLLTLVAGFLFGFFLAFIYSVLSATVGGLASFFLMRYLFAEFVQQRYEKKLQVFTRAMQAYGNMYLVLVRFIPVIPFFVVNMIASCLPITWQTFVITTAIGVMPIALIYSYAGRELSYIHSVHDIFTMRIILLFVCLLIIGLVPLFLQYRKRQK